MVPNVGPFWVERPSEVEPDHKKHNRNHRRDDYQSPHKIDGNLGRSNKSEYENNVGRRSEFGTCRQKSN